MGQQLDLAQLRSGAGLVLYENLAWIPRAAVAAAVPGRVPVDSARPEPRRARNRPHPRGAAHRRPPFVPGTILWGEAYDSEWDATSGGRSLRHEQAFGWANGFAAGRPGKVTLAYGEQWTRWAMLGGALVIWLFVFWRWRRTRVRRDPAERAHAARARRERRQRYDPLADVVDESFWWERV